MKKIVIAIPIPANGSMSEVSNAACRALNDSGIPDFQLTECHHDDEVLKQNMIRLVDHHRATCPGQTCNISLYLAECVMKAAGIDLTQPESSRFS
jgi:hypothetical protein